MKHLMTAWAFAALSMAAEPPPVPLLTLPVRVHLVQSATDMKLNTSLTETDVQRIFKKVNMIWAQAGIHFELEAIRHTQALDLPVGPKARLDDDLMRAAMPAESRKGVAINVFYVKKLGPNGFYYGEAIAVKDTAALKPVKDGLDEPIPRVTAHEIGHQLGLKHRQDNLNLMASGRNGYSLNDEEIKTARAKALIISSGKVEGGSP